MPRGEGEGSVEPTMTYMYDAKDMWDRQACPKQPRTPFGEEGGRVGRYGHDRDWVRTNHWPTLGEIYRLQGILVRTDVSGLVSG